MVSLIFPIVYLVSISLKLSYWFKISFFHIGIYSYKFPSEHCFDSIPKFLHVVFSFSFVSTYFLNSTAIPNSTHWLCISMHFYNTKRKSSSVFNPLGLTSPLAFWIQVPLTYKGPFLSLTTESTTPLLCLIGMGS